MGNTHRFGIGAQHQSGGSVQRLLSWRERIGVAPLSLRKALVQVALIGKPKPKGLDTPDNNGSTGCFPFSAKWRWRLPR
jgi:hypothetical protein